MTQKIMSALAQRCSTQDPGIYCLSKDEILLGAFFQAATLIQESYFCFEEKTTCNSIAV